MNHMLKYLTSTRRRGCSATRRRASPSSSTGDPSSTWRRSPRTRTTRTSRRGATTGDGSARAHAPASGTRRTSFGPASTRRSTATCLRTVGGGGVRSRPLRSQWAHVGDSRWRHGRIAGRGALCPGRTWGSRESLVPLHVRDRFHALGDGCSDRSTTCRTPRRRGSRACVPHTDPRSIWAVARADGRSSLRGAAGTSSASTWYPGICAGTAMCTGTLCVHVESSRSTSPRCAALVSAQASRSFSTRRFNHLNDSQRVAVGLEVNAVVSADAPSSSSCGHAPAEALSHPARAPTTSRRAFPPGGRSLTSEPTKVKGTHDRGKNIAPRWYTWGGAL